MGTKSLPHEGLRDRGRETMGAVPGEREPGEREPARQGRPHRTLPAGMYLVSC